MLVWTIAWDVFRRMPRVGRVLSHAARGTYFVVRRLEVVAVAGLLWISCGVFRVRRDFCSFFFDFVSSSNEHGLLQV